MVFEWDEIKAKENIIKHGISFENATKVFFDDCRIEIYDFENSTATEERFDIIGMADNILFVVYTVKTESYRLISARLATKVERKMYEQRKNNRR